MAGGKKKRKQRDISLVSPHVEVPGGSSPSVANMSDVMEIHQALKSQIQDHELKFRVQLLLFYLFIILEFCMYACF